MKSNLWSFHILYNSTTPNMVESVVQIFLNNNYIDIRNMVAPETTVPNNYIIHETKTKSSNKPFMK